MALVLFAGLLPVAPAAALETPRTATFEDVSLGMSSDAMRLTLVSRGFLADEESRTSYSDDTGAVRRIVRFRDVPVLGGRVVNELDYLLWFESDHFDAVGFEREIRERFGEPQHLVERQGGRELHYREIESSPTVGDVQDACQAEIEAAEPGIRPGLAETMAHMASEYRAHNGVMGRICPGTRDLYRRFAAGVEAPRMRVVILPAAGRVVTELRWFGPAAPIGPSPESSLRNACPYVPWREFGS